MLGLFKKTQVQEVDLLVVDTAISDEVFYAMNQADDFSAGVFGDNGGDPDGAGPYLAEASDIERTAIQAAIVAGASLQMGYKFEYGYNHEAAQNSGLPFSGYQANRVAYALSKETAQKVYELSHAEE